MSSQLAQSLKFVGPLGALARPVIVATILFGLWRALSSTRISVRSRTVAWWSAAVFILAWLGAVWTFAARGTFASFSGGSPVGEVTVLLVVLAGIVAVALTSVGRSGSMRSAIRTAPLSWLIGVQVYRILGFIFLRLWSRGLLPGYFALPAGIGDILVGVTALPLALSIRSNSRLSRRLALAWNMFGILDLVNALTMGVTSILAQPSTAVYPLLIYPLAMVPMFGVPLALILHSLSIWQLRRRLTAGPEGSRGTDRLHTELA